MKNILLLLVFISTQVAAQNIDPPIIADFSRKGNEPCEQYWQDNYVKTSDWLYYQDHPAGEGVAVFDAMDENGNMYSYADWNGFLADRLTSHPINMDFYWAADTWFTFRYQPGGRGDTIPGGESDKFVLQFREPGAMRWDDAWSVYADKKKDSLIEIHHFDGDNRVAKAYDNQKFYSVQIELASDENKYLEDGTQFRFINYASVPFKGRQPSMDGNQDHWLLDWVRLDQNRSVNDTTIDDVGFIKPQKVVSEGETYYGLKMLEYYESVPWNHWPDAKFNEMDTTISITYRNFGNKTWNISREFKIIDKTGVNSTFSFTGGGGDDISPYTTETYPRSVQYTFPDNGRDTALYEVQAYLTTDTVSGERALYRYNDTIRRMHYFGDYYAEDDGTAEGAYYIMIENGISTQYYRQKYRIYTQDVLNYVDIYFTQGLLGNNSYDLLEIKIWTGTGYNIRSKTVQKPSGKGWKRYSLSGSTWEVTTDYIYVGIYPANGNDRQPIPVGLDKDSDGVKEYNNTGSWERSNLEGAMMIRPVFK